MADDYNSNQIAEEQFRRYCYLRDNGHLDYVKKANRCDAFYLGDQWDPVDKARLAVVRRPALTINKVLPTIANLQGEYINTRVDTALKSSRVGAEDISGVMEKVLRKSFDTQQYRWQEGGMYDDGLITSRGFIDVRLSFKENMQGELAVSNPNPRNVLIDCDAEEYDPDTWNDVLHSKWLSLVDIAVLFGKKYAEELRYYNPTSTEHSFDSVDRQMETFKSSPHHQGYVESSVELRRNIRVIERQVRELTKQEFFVDMVTGEMRAIPDSWERNKIAFVIKKYDLAVVENFVKRIRWRTTAGPCVLHDKWSPYRYFSIVPFFPYFRRGKTMGAVENLLDSQELLNKVTSQELHVVNTTANSGWKIEQGNLKNMSVEELEQRGAQTGIVLELGTIDGAEKIEPNQVPTGLDRISYKAEEHIKTISTVNDTTLGDDREDVAAKAMQEKKKSQSLNTMKMQDNLGRSRWLIARNAIDIIQTYFTEHRIYRFTKDELLGETEDIEVNKYDEATGRIVNDLTAGELEIVITTTPQKDTVAESEFQQGIAMRELGIAIPDELLIENSNLRSKGKLLRKMKEASESHQAQEEAALMAESKRLAVQQQAVDVEETQADILLKSANAQKNMAEAAAGPDPVAPGEDPDLERERMAHESEENELDRALKREEMQHDANVEAIKQEFEARTQASEQNFEASSIAAQQSHEALMTDQQQAHDARTQAVDQQHEDKAATRDAKFGEKSSKQQHKQKVTETKVAAKVKPKPKKESK